METHRMDQGNEPVERLTQRIGKEIFARVSHGPIPFGPTWWDDRLMDLTMSDETLKVQLFRFVDVLPQLDTPEAIIGHLRDNSREPGPDIPAWARWGVWLLPSRGLLARVAAGVVRWGA